MFPQGKKEKDREAISVAGPSQMRARLEKDMDYLLDEFWRRPLLNFWSRDHWWPGRLSRVLDPAVDIYEENDEVVVKAEMPGISKDNLEVSVAGSTVINKGEKKKV